MNFDRNSKIVYNIEKRNKKGNSKFYLKEDNLILVS
ncbi:hypothetical protein ES703_90628 [subsurface metagenome]